MPQARVDIRHLAMLQAIAEGGNLTRASERLFVTQSALSHQLKGLETAYGVELVERESRPLRFTPAGQRLLRLAQGVLPQVADAERDIARLLEGRAGTLRVAVECHTCFDWLMPAMDAFRPRWPEVELDIVSGFTTDPVPMLLKDQADFAVIHDESAPRRGVVFEPLFEYETVALVARDHRLAGRARLEARDFAQETLITYPVEDDKLDVMRHVLLPAGVQPRAKRQVELTVAILQLVASGRGIAALPAWSVAPYLDRGYVLAKPIGRKGLRCALFGATTAHLAESAYIQEFIELIRGVGAAFAA